MHLKGLEVQGFKSFPDKTNILFTNGITAIVGPNGSGKSNIADAVRWVLGEQSSKTLRGVKMEDVVFDGTQDRKPLGFAEVSLTIDNSDSVLPLAYNDITITRRYYRSGESEYFINRAPVRLKDINELLMDTGLGKDGYSIIGQGRIAEILSVKSEDRRQIFEEAAGISKYRYRKAESERKLDAAEENLLRLRDIAAELEERVGPLKEQSEKAQKYLILRDEKRVLEISIWLNSIDTIKAGLSKLEADCVNAKNLLADSDTKLETIEHQIDSTFEATKQITIEIDNIRQEIREIEEQSAGISSETAILKNDIQHNNDFILKIENEMQLDKDKTAEIDTNIEEKRRLIEELHQKSSDLSGELATIITENQSLELKNKEQSEQIQKKTADLVAVNGEITELKIKESGISHTLFTTEEKLQALLSENASRNETYQNTLQGKNECEKGITLRENKQKALSNIINGYTLKLSTRKEKAEAGRKSFEKLRLDLLEKNQRIHMLTDMQKHFDGFGGSVKAVMEEKAKNGLSGIYGPVSSIIKVSDEHSLAIETALGAAIQNIVVETENDAKAAIYYLKSAGAGRATFLPLTSVKGTAVRENEVSSYAGFIGIASTLVEYQSKFSGIIDSLLGRTVIVDHIDNAIRLAKSTGYRFRIVTMDGQQVNAGGSLTGGSTVKNAGILTRANEIERLTEQLSLLQEKYEKAEIEQKELEADIASIAASLDGANAEYRVLEDELIRERNEFTHFTVLIEGLQGAIDNFETEKAEIESQIEDLKTQSLNIKEKIAELEKAEEEVRLSLDNLNQSGTELLTKREEFSTKINEKRMEILAVSKDIENEEAQISALNSQKELQALSGEKRLFEIEALQQKNNQLTEKIAELNGLFESFTAKISEKNANITALQQKREETEKQVTILREKEKQEIELKNKYTAEVERLEGKKANVQIECDGLILKLWDEYELSLSEARQFVTELESVQKASKRVSDIKNEMKKLGDVNLSSIEEYKQVKERYELLTAQLTDIEKAKEELLKIITELTSKMREIFSEQFKVINENFNVTFKELFGGGTAKLELSDPEDILTSGIEIKVAPPGKIIKHLSSLSGGEQAFVAIALYFSILRVRPTPFCLLDEIEAALDDVNVIRYAEYLRKLTNKTQFIAITHRRGTMEEADTLYGVTMQEKGVSKLLTINVNEMAEKMNIS